MTRFYFSICKYGTVSCILLLLFVLFFQNVPVNGENLQSSNNSIQNTVSHILHVKYANHTAPDYDIKVNADKYTLDQTYSWVRDQTSRYNLIAYSLDANQFIPIPRSARGNFTLDLSMNSDHLIEFSAVPQFPLDVSDVNSITFSPPSPTSDNWFDSGSDVQLSVPYVLELQQNSHRLQIVGWTIDGFTSTIDRSDSGLFKTPPIHMSDTHIISFQYVTQFYLNVESSNGQPTGNGWYDKGSTATIEVKPTNDFPIRHVFSGWDGNGIEVTGQYSAKAVVDAPKTVVAKWTLDYSVAIIIGGISAAGVVAIAGFYYKNRSKSMRQIQPVQQSQKFEQEDLSIDPRLSLDKTDVYSKEIMSYVTQKTIEKIESMHASGLLSDERYSKIKEEILKSD